MNLERGPHLIGKDITPEDEGQFKKKTQEERHTALEKVKGEVEKTEEDIKAIELANSWIGALVESYGIKGFKPVNADQVHMYGAESDLFFSGDHGFADIYKDQIYINVGDEHSAKDLFDPKDPNLEEKEKAFIRYKRIHTITHEILHLAGFQSYSAEKENNNLAWTNRRTGYFYANDFKPSKPEHFLSLNEAVVETIAKRLLAQHAEEFTEPHFSVKDYLSNIFYGDDYYKKDRLILSNIVQDIAEHEEKSTEDTWEKLIKGYFEGNLLHLRVIDKIYGKGTIRLYAGIKADNREQLFIFEAYLKAPSPYSKRGFAEDLEKLISRSGPIKLS